MSVEYVAGRTIRIIIVRLCGNEKSLRQEHTKIHLYRDV